MIAEHRDPDAEPSRVLVAVLALLFVALCLSAAIGAVWLGLWWAWHG